MYPQALAQARMNSLMQLSRALNDARVEKEAAIAQAVAHAKAEKMEAVADERQEQLIKVLPGHARLSTRPGREEIIEL